MPLLRCKKQKMRAAEAGSAAPGAYPAILQSGNGWATTCEVTYHIITLIAKFGKQIVVIY